MNIKNICLSAICALAIGSQAQAQLVNTNFGQNRLQHESYKWYRYESPHFAVSFPEELEEMAQYVVETAEEDYVQLKSILEYDTRNKIEIIIYADYSDYLQNNIGLYTQVVNNGNTTKLFSHKILTYFNGNHSHLRAQVREGTARALVNRMIYGGNLQEIVQNAVLLQLPLWFTEGIIAYATEEWNEEKDDALREAFLGGKYGDFIELSKAKPALAGQSMFHYITQKSGSSAVSNLVYLSRTYRSAETGFTYVFGTSFYAVAAEWFEFYQKRYNTDNENRKIPSKGELTVDTKHKAVVGQTRISPDGKHAAYVSQYQGQQYIWLHHIADNKASIIWQTGLKDLAHNTVPDYPRIAFSQNSATLIFSNNDKNQLQLYVYNLSDKKIGRKVNIKGLESIHSMDAFTNQEIVTAATQEGRSDIYLINTQTGKTQALTNDLWDDVEVATAKLGGANGILFTSTRNNNNLNPTPAKFVDNNRKTDLFFLNTDKKSPLLRLSNSRYAQESAPLALSSNSFGFISDESGILNRYVGGLDTLVDYYNEVFVLKDKTSLTFHQDSAKIGLDETQVDSQYHVAVYKYEGKSEANTDYSRCILEHSYSSAQNKILDLIYYQDAFRIFVRDFINERKETPAITKYRTYYNDYFNIQPQRNTGKVENNPNPSKEPQKIENPAENRPDSSLPKPQPNADTSRIDIDNYLFQSEFGEIEKPKPTIKDSLPPNNKPQPTILVEGENGEINKEAPKEKPVPVIVEDKTLKFHKYDGSQKTLYRNLFRADGFAFQVDNTPLFGGLDLYLNNNYRFTPLSLLSKVNFSDIFENYRIEIGVRIPLTFNGFDCYFVLDDRKGKLDKKYSFYRRSRIDDFNLVDTSNGNTLPVKGRNLKYLAQFELKYPIDRYRSVRGQAAIQSDRVAIIATEINSLAVPIFIRTKAWLRGEYVFDNAVEMSLNFRKGTRFKAYLDIFKPFEIETNPNFRLNLDGGLTANIGFDYRRYFSLDNKTIFAVRVAGATSLGQQKLLYSLGGVENGIFAQTNTTIPLPQTGEFAYQTLAAPLRGFGNNIRNGNSFTVINAELRIPVIRYLAGRTRSNFLRTLQIVPFFDLGTAWHGLSPFSKDNPLNTSIIDRGIGGAVSPIRVRVQYYRQPIVMAFGTGIRTMVSGHLLRLDIGFGIETGLIQLPTLHLGLGTDF